MGQVYSLLRSDLSHRGIALLDAEGKAVKIVPAHNTNYDVARQGQPRIHEMLVFHSTEGYNSENWFQKPNVGASTPWIVKESGIVHCVPNDYVAYAQGTFTNPNDQRFNDKLIRDGGRPSWMPPPPYSCLLYTSPSPRD